MSINDLQLEIKRKLFHLQSLVFPLTYLFVSKGAMIFILLIIAIITLYIDISRNYNLKIKEIVDKFFSYVMRNEEKSGFFKLSGSSYMIAGFLFSAILFPKELTITSWLILIICDPIAAVIGIKIGIKKYYGKSVEGGVAFFITSVFVSIICCLLLNYETNFSIIFLASLLTSLSEFYSKKLKLDDNFLIPVVYGMSSSLLIFVL